jgi:hypothetical protein
MSPSCIKLCKICPVEAVEGGEKEIIVSQEERRELRLSCSPRLHPL